MTSTGTSSPHLLEYRPIDQLFAVVTPSTSSSNCSTSSVNTDATPSDRQPHYQLSTCFSTAGESTSSRRRQRPAGDLHGINDFERLPDDLYVRKYRKKYLIFIPPNLQKTSLNIRLDPLSLEEKYVILMFPTLQDNLLPAALYNPPHLLMHLELSLAPERSTPHHEDLMKIMIWNCRGAHNQEFRRNLRFLLTWNNPSIL